MSERLKPCPYCGGYPAIYGLAKNGGLIWKLRLGESLKAESTATEFQTQAEAYAYWNRRVKDEQSRND
ncbi:MAG: hypothetical protein IJR43_10620 [Synergistaceae bacterium]|nr:hypothetical protein [Synergistaceae bacterium]MBQ9629695.1 hypothetical protein [Synergistaceae bacterium]